MSYDLTVATQSRPSKNDVEAFLEHRPSLNAQGSLEGGRVNVLVEKRTSRGTLPLFIVDGPFSVEATELPDALATATQGARWIVGISVPAAGMPHGLSTARALARYLAKERTGAVYDPQDEQIIWPKQS